MARWRVGLAFTIIGVMAIALVVILLDGGAGESGVGQTSTSTTPSTANPTSTTADTTSTTLDGSARVQEVQAILEDLETRRFQAIYEQDLDALAEVAEGQVYSGTVTAIEAGVGNEYGTAPAATGVSVEILDVLADRPDCLAVHFNVDLSGFLQDANPDPLVFVLWPTDGYWRSVKVWGGPGDFDEQIDCDLAIRGGES